MAYERRRGAPEVGHLEHKARVGGHGRACVGPCCERKLVVERVDQAHDAVGPRRCQVAIEHAPSASLLTVERATQLLQSRWEHPRVLRLVPAAAAAVRTEETDGGQGVGQDGDDLDFFVRLEGGLQ